MVIVPSNRRYRMCHFQLPGLSTLVESRPQLSASNAQRSATGNTLPVSGEYQRRVQEHPESMFIRTGIRT